MLFCVLVVQGPLCQYALDALDSIMDYAATAQEVLEFQQQQKLSITSSSSSAEALPPGLAPQPAGAAADSTLGNATAVGGASAATAGVDLQGLAACLLPQLDVVDLLQRVLDSSGIRPRRKKYRLLPFLAEHAMPDIHQAVDGLSDG